MKTMFFSFINRIFTKSFWKAFIPLSAAACLLFFLEYGRYSTFDPGFEPKHFLMCVFTLIIWSFCMSLSIRAIGIWKTLPVFCLTLLLLAMDYVNFSEFITWEDDGPSGSRMMNFYCTYYHAASVTSFFLIINLLSFCCQSKILSFFRTFLYSVLFLFSLAVIGNKLLSGNGLNEDAMIAILQTNRQEAFHYFFGLNNGLLLLFWIFLATLVLCLIIRYAFSPFKDRIKRHKLLTKTLAYCCAAALLPCIAMGIKGSMYHYFAPRMYRAMNYPIAFSRDLKVYNQNRADYIKELQTRLSSMNKGDCFSGKYVIVIGESLNRNYMGCYGYSKNTTPFQSRLKNDDNCILFKNAFSCHVQTPRVLLLILTNLNQYNGKGYEISDATSILDIANFYQYQTGWISAQEKIAVANSTISALAESANYIYYSTEKIPYRDLDVIRQLNESKMLDHGQSLVFVHLNGNHYPYHLSFPSDMTFDEQDLSIYEKSVCFNDMNLSQLYDLARSNDVDVLLYVSDHSEAVSVRKGHDPRYYLQEMAEIPFWIYLSDNYKKKHPEIADRLHAASEQIITNDIVFDLLLYLMGVDNEFIDKTLVPGSKDYRINEENARTLYGQQHISINKKGNNE